MLALNERTLELYDGLVADGVEFEMHKDGLLFLFLDQRAAEEEAAVLEDLRRHGYPGDVRRLTLPRHRSSTRRSATACKGAFLAAAERSRAPRVADGGSRLGAPGRTDVELREGVEVTTIAAGRGGWRAPGRRTRRSRPTECSSPAGAWTGRVLAPLGVKIRQEAAKGYSLTAQGEGTRPRHAPVPRRGKGRLQPRTRTASGSPERSSSPG